MKNLHVLPTDKPTGIFKSGDNLLFSIMNKVRTTHEGFHIYITSDEEIKEGDWFMIFTNKKPVAPTKAGLFDSDCKKIILTTDQDLIKDGVQAISDEFIEWFVNNPRCEWVEVKKEMYMPFDGKVPFELSLDQSLNTCPHYKIITKDYLQGFIDLHNNELEHWEAVEFLEWLKLNDFKIVKK